MLWWNMTIDFYFVLKYKCYLSYLKACFFFQLKTWALIKYFAQAGSFPIVHQHNLETWRATSRHLAMIGYGIRYISYKRLVGVEDSLMRFRRWGTPWKGWVRKNRCRSMGNDASCWAHRRRTTCSLRLTCTVCRRWAAKSWIRKGMNRPRHA